MIALWFALGFMALCAAALLVRPFVLALGEDAAAPNAGEALRAELADIDAAIARGDMDADAAVNARIEAERRVLRADEKKAPQERFLAPDRRPAIAIAAFVLLGAGALYAGIGRPNLIAAPPTPQIAAEEELARATAEIEAKLKTNPDDAAGWRALGYAYFIAGRYDDAGTAYQHAIALRGDDPTFHSAYGEALVGQASGKVSDAALKEFKAAFALDPHDVRARFYIGLHKAQHGDDKAALEDWFALYKEAPPGSDAAAEIRRQIESLAQQDGIDVSARFADAGPSTQDIEGAAQMSQQERDAMIDAMVTSLDKRLRQDPSDLAGWIKLIHARVVQSKQPEAADALARARAAFVGDRQALAALDQAAFESGLR